MLVDSVRMSTARDAGWAEERGSKDPCVPRVRLLEDGVQVIITFAALVEHPGEVLVDVHQVGDEDAPLAPLLQKAACRTQAARTN